MAQRTKSKTTSKRPSQTSRAKIKKSSNKNSSVKPIPPAVSILLLSILLTLIIFLPLRTQIVLFVYNWYCVKPTSDSQLVYDVWKFNNSIHEDKSSRDKLLSLLNEEVIWFKGNPKNKEFINFYSEYDDFNFSAEPKYIDKENPYDGNYQLTFNGIHKYRNPTNNLVKLTGGSAVVVNGKLSEIRSLTKYESKKPEAINYVYKYYFWFSLGICTLMIYFLNSLTKMPVELISFLWQIISKFLRVS